MTPHQFFLIANFAALCSWILLIVLPGKTWVTRAITGMAVPMAFAAVYIVIVVLSFPGAEGGFSSLDGVAALFANPWMLLAGWIHYLAFDLLVGTWEAKDARDRGVPHLALVPCLLLTFMFGPAGWLLYLGVRTVGARGHA